MTETLIIGRGLLGDALAKVSSSAHFVDRSVRWGDPVGAAADLTWAIDRFVDVTSGPRAIAWCAGGGYVGADADMMSLEARLLQSTLAHAATLTDGWTAFVASSAGGVYGRGRQEVFDDFDAPQPASPYGTAKVEVEVAASAWAEHHGATALIGRIANLYGPAQRLSKAQGLVSHMCRAAITRLPMALFVPAETQRDYIHVDDAAARIALWIAETEGGQQAVETKIVATGRATSVAGVLATVTRVTRVRPPVVFSVDARTALQPRFVRLRSTWRPDLDLRTPARPLEVGVREMWSGLLGTRL